MEPHLSLDANNWNKGLYEACYRDYKELALLMIEKGADDWNKGLEGACQGGHKELALLMIEKGANNWNEGLCAACDCNQKELALLMIKKGANDWNEGLIAACIGGHDELVLLMIEKGASIDKCFTCLMLADYIYLFHKNIKSSDKRLDREIRVYQKRKQLAITNYEDFWVRMLLNNYL